MVEEPKIGDKLKVITSEGIKEIVILAKKEGKGFHEFYYEMQLSDGTKINIAGNWKKMFIR